MNKSAKLAILAFLLTFSACLQAQQEKGDKEIGLDGAAVLSNSKPFTGNIFSQISFGKYIEKRQYIGVYAAPQFNISGGDFAGEVGLGGEYRYLLGHRNSRLWPFVGVQGGESIARGGGSWSHGESAAPEFGLKFYASQKTAFEVSYLLMIQFNGGASYSSFADRTQNLVVFGFRHIF